MPRTSICSLWLTLYSSLIQAANFTIPLRNGSEVYRPLITVHSNSTPKFENVSRTNVNPLIRVLLASSIGTTLDKRQDTELPVGTCAPGTPCVNGACCSSTGICGYSPDQCGSDVCLSNCDAKAECGQYGVPGNNSCPLNVCCSKHGFCGTTTDYCDDECQDEYGQCGDAPAPSCSGASAGRTVGYYEAWSSRRVCMSKTPSDLDATGFTHLVFAFAYFHPTTFQITPMDAADIPLYSEFTGLKSRKASLRTWIAIGGWSFNDPVNVPDTQRAFSDMSSSSESCAAFIRSCLQFMQTYGFDGVDLDWEYPGAWDRGGINADTQNLVSLLQEMRAAFGNSYGISLTLPSSFWYLRWFDINGMQDYVDFYNFMSYDIHGVWDSTNKETGPYIRPHTNLTQIKDGLDLLWRNDVDPQKVNLGLGWYGRSFTLADPSCNTPGCVFKSGGTPGRCNPSPDAAGTLMNAEIIEIIQQNGLTPVFDKEAAVKWITWNNDQWVSYDDGETTSLKLQAANELCLGGKMIWALDQDDVDSTSNHNLLGLEGLDPELVRELAAAQLQAEVDATTRQSCYWTFCGGQCVEGYFETTYAKGQVSGLSRSTTCSGSEFQTLCCAAGTTTGTCHWDGWRGVGLSCAAGGCSSANDSVVAVNSHPYDGEDSIGKPCNGGTQSYCCNGFIPSPKYDTTDLVLVGQGGITKRQSISQGTCYRAGLATSAATAGALGFFTGPVGFFFGGISSLLATAIACSSGSKPSKPQQDNAVAVGLVAKLIMSALDSARKSASSTVTKTVTLTVVPVPATQSGWTILPTTRGQTDCQVTYTCRYGQNFDEICDNQRWAIDDYLGGNTVYHQRNRAGRYFKDDWDNWRADRYRSAARPSLPGLGRYRCEVDEFPMGGLREATWPNTQVLRFVNGPANGRQGGNFGVWKQLVWEPCSALRSANGRGAPPITWAFDGYGNGDGRGQANGQHFIQAYGFDSQTQNSECWATYTKGANGAARTVTDQGFRAHPADPMFAAPFNYPASNYRLQPESYPDNQLPQNVNMGSWLKRSLVRRVLQRKNRIEDIFILDQLLEDDVEVFDDGTVMPSLYWSPPPPEPTQLHTADVVVTSKAVLPGSPMVHRTALPVETGTSWTA